MEMWWANTMEYYSVLKKLYYTVFSKMNGAKRHDAKYSKSGIDRQAVHSISHAVAEAMSLNGNGRLGSEGSRKRKDGVV